MKSNRGSARALNPYRSLDRAAVALGLVSVLSGAFIFVHGMFQIVQIGAISLVVALVLGLLAMAAGWLSEATLMVATGVGFLLAAGVQVVLLAAGSGGFQCQLQRAVAVAAFSGSCSGSSGAAKRSRPKAQHAL